MDAISKADLFVALLRQRLAERASAKGAQRKRTSSAGKTAKAARSLSGQAARASADDRFLRRTIVEELLTDRLGARLANEPRFQQIVGEVTAILAEDDDLRGLLEEVAHAVREGA